MGLPLNDNFYGPKQLDYVILQVSVSGYQGGREKTLGTASRSTVC